MNNFLLWLLVGSLMNNAVCFSASLSEFMDHLEKERYFKNASLSIYVFSEKDNKAILNYHGEKSLISNSIVKVITTATALKVLGEGFQFRTKLLAAGTIKDQTLEGDLVILGDGDPTLGSAHEGYNLSDKDQLAAWALSLKTKGIKEIKGSVVGDASCFEKALSSAAWLWEDLGNYYGAGPCGLNFHENFYTIFFKLGSAIGDLTTIDRIEPAVNNLKIVNEVLSASKGTGDKAYVFGGEFATTQYIRGTLPLDNPFFKIKGCIPNPALFCADNLKVALEKEGISIKGESRASFDKSSFVDGLLLDERLSPKLSEIVFLANKLSLNLHCEALLKKMGQVRKGEGSYSAGLAVVNEYLKGLEIPLEGFNIADGSGLSNKNLVTAKGFVEFLCKISKETYFPTLLNSLPSNKINDLGRLKNVFSNETLSERVFAKTGYSSQGESFVGFLINNRGEKLYFCVICNHFLGPSAIFRKELQRLFDILVMH